MTHSPFAWKSFLANVSNPKQTASKGVDKDVKLADFEKVNFSRGMPYVVYLCLAFVVFNLFLVSPAVALADSPAVAVNTPNRLRIPAIGLNSEIVPVASEIVDISGNKYRRWATSDNLVGWHNLSAQPGQVGNTVLTGHSDIYARVFRNLRYVEIGSEIIVVSGGREYHYQVAQRILVREQGASVAERARNGKLIDPTPDERLTLITCANPGATHRLIIIARPVTAN